MTALLTRALSKTIEVNGERVSGKRLLARLATDVLTTGMATFPDGKALDVAPKDWLEFVKWAYAHIDGAAKQEMELSGPGGGPLMLQVIETIVDATGNPTDEATK